MESYKNKLCKKIHFVRIILNSLKVIDEKPQVNQVVPYTLLPYGKISWAGTAALFIEVECCYTVAILVWCSTHQLPGCKCTGKSLCALFRCIYAVYMGIYGYM